jgi:hypothetical protein
MVTAELTLVESWAGKATEKAQEETNAELTEAHRKLSVLSTVKDATVSCGNMPPYDQKGLKKVRNHSATAAS